MLNFLFGSKPRFVPDGGGKSLETNFFYELQRELREYQNNRSTALESLKGKTDAQLLPSLQQKVASMQAHLQKMEELITNIINHNLIPISNEWLSGSRPSYYSLLKHIEKMLSKKILDREKLRSLLLDCTDPYLLNLLASLDAYWTAPGSEPGPYQEKHKETIGKLICHLVDQGALRA